VIDLTIKELAPGEIDAGTAFSIFVVIMAEPACALRGAPFLIRQSDRTLFAGELPELVGDRRDTAEILLTAPRTVGAFTWALVLPAREADGIHSVEVSRLFSFTTRPHMTSLAVWGVPSPIAAGHTASVNAGVRCAIGCTLGGGEIGVCDVNGLTVARGYLGDTPWPGTAALYWTSIEFPAPLEIGRFSWSVTFSDAEVDVPHVSASAALGFSTVRAPEHRVSVTVADKDARAPIADVQVRVGPYRASTDEAGVARVDVPAGEHAIVTWRSGYDAPDASVSVTGPTNVLIEMTALPEEDPFAFWRG
jgi:hypothetical protein